MNYINSNAGFKGRLIHLYRGQPKDYSLLPSIARISDNLRNEICNNEIKSLEEFIRYGSTYTDASLELISDAIIYAQHYGLKTRLLDWTSNALIALWFACQEYKTEDTAYVYHLTIEEETIIPNTKSLDIFNLTNIKIVKPKLNNKRLIAQDGWFSIHNYNRTDSKYEPLTEKSEEIISLSRIPIEKHSKDEILNYLGNIGFNYRTIFPDFYGLTSYLNHEYHILK